MTQAKAIQTPARPPQLAVESVGQPVAVSSLARLLLRLHTQPNLHLVPHEQPRCPVPAQLQGPQ
jgi:hypothetical protein